MKKLILVLLLFGCSKEVPPEKKVKVQVRIDIEFTDGHLEYSPIIY